MYLKSLEVQGFKSFANKIIFEFHNGITAIVGPNGSGKSNVGDAVRWVLGEQSAKQLRGGSMQDVIFAGTENRKALGFAYVAITLDNSDRKLPIDYEEVTIARRVYRSGESEYLINGTGCRLRDVHELFYDTGIGKEGYSIIGQGQIDKILSGKPDERRELFDEAAGIVKFKRRKLTAQKKLEDEKQNLIRVNDILSELTKQLAPLERQSETARIYLKKKEELKIYDVNMFLLEMSRMKEQLQEIQKKITIADAQLVDTTSQYENTKTEYEKLQYSIEVLDEQIESKKERSNKAALRGQQLEGQINVLREQIKTAQLNDEHLKNRIDSIQKALKDKEERKLQYKNEKSEIDEQIEAIRKTQEEASLQLEKVKNQIASDNEQIDAEKANIIELLNQRASTKAKAQRYDTMLEQNNISKASLNQKILQMKSDESTQDELIESHKVQYAEVCKVLDSLSVENARLDVEVNKVTSKLMEMNKHLDVGLSTFHRESSKLESLKNITERYDGYGNSIRKVMEQKEKEKGIIGVVADIIKVEKSYEVAIETALGGSIQNIVTDNEITAKNMIDYLKRNKYGRATFLPLTGINSKNSFHNEKALSEPGVIGLASELVTSEKEFQGLAGYLLGRTLVVDHIDHAIALAKQFRHSLRIVTLEGESLSPGGSMTGGAFRNSSNLLGRRREIEELEESVNLLKKDIAELQNDIEQRRASRVELRGDISKIKESLNKQYLIQNTLKINIQQYQSKKEETQVAYSNLLAESRDIENQVKEIMAGKSGIDRELTNSIEKEKESELLILEMQSKLEAERLVESEYLKSTEANHLELANLIQKQEFSVQNVQRINSEMEHLLEEENIMKDNAKDTAYDVSKKEKDILQIGQTIEAALEELKTTNIKVMEMQKEKENLSASYKSFFTKQDELSKRMNLLDKESFRLNNQREKLEDTSENQINYMWEEYELTNSSAAVLKNDEYTDLLSLKKDIAAIKEEIRKLGDVNVNAIEDYKNLHERHEFLTIQQDDLVKAEETLQKIIEELDEGMRKQFKEKFEEIQVEFDKAFKQLFGGGKGTLQLSEDQDILEAGITIISQPPGKKLQNMMQLSGGEKALTAIALLFAIQNLKPSPFCLLDEIEAALDDSNVTRYAQYLHKLTKNTQFIIITHRRGTMAAADRLYGITMQEKGVSTLVSVNLIKEDLEK